MGEADRQLVLARQELAIPFSGLEQERQPRAAVEEVYQKINTLLEQIHAQKKIYDREYSTKEVLQEIDEAQERIQLINQNRATAQQYERSFALLLALKNQREPLAGVEEELNVFLKTVKELRRDNSVSITELTHAMNAAYDVLTGGSKETFDNYTHYLHGQDSIPLKMLGATLILLGAALVISAILFAPAVITAAGTSLATIYLASAGVAAASSALSIGGTACFFAKTNRMKLAEMEQNLGNSELDDHHYNPVYPSV